MKFHDVITIRLSERKDLRGGLNVNFITKNLHEVNFDQIKKIIPKNFLSKYIFIQLWLY